MFSAILGGIIALMLGGIVLVLVTKNEIRELVGKLIMDIILGGIIGIFALIFATILTIPFALWNAYVCMHLWNWFMVPIFNIQPIDFLLTWGLIIVINAFKGYATNNKINEETEDWKKELIKGLKISITSSLALGIAFLMGHILHRLI